MVDVVQEDNWGVTGRSGLELDAILVKFEGQVCCAGAARVEVTAERATRQRNNMAVG